MIDDGCDTRIIRTIPLSRNNLGFWKKILNYLGLEKIGQMTIDLTSSNSLNLICISSIQELNFPGFFFSNPKLFRIPKNEHPK